MVVVVVVVVVVDDYEISWLLMSDTDRPTQTVQNRSNLLDCTLYKTLAGMKSGLLTQG